MYCTVLYCTVLYRPVDTSIGAAGQWTVHSSTELSPVVCQELTHGLEVKVKLSVLQPRLQADQGPRLEGPPSHGDLAVEEAGAGGHLQHRAQAPGQSDILRLSQHIGDKHDTTAGYCQNQQTECSQVEIQVLKKVFRDGGCLHNIA